MPLGRKFKMSFLIFRNSKNSFFKLLSSMKFEDELILHLSILDTTYNYKLITYIKSKTCNK